MIEVEAVVEKAHAFCDGCSTNPTVRLLWSDDDPFAFSLTVDQGDVRTTWRMGRDLVARGLRAIRRSVGEGDVLVRSPGGCMYAFTLKPPDVPSGYVLLPRGPVEELVRRVEAIVPADSQDESDIVQAELEVWLAGLRDAA